MWITLAAVVLFLGVLYWQGSKAMERDRQELERLKSLPHYNRLCLVVDDKGRELTCRVREWDVRPGHSALWCIDPISHPNGWTQSFLWPNKDIEFLEN
jgi:hypothetical protein